MGSGYFADIGDDWVPEPKKRATKACDNCAHWGVISDHPTWDSYMDIQRRQTWIEVDGVPVPHDPQPTDRWQPCQVDGTAYANAAYKCSKWAKVETAADGGRP